MAKLEIESKLSHVELYDKMFVAGTIDEQEWVIYYYHAGKEDQLSVKFEQLRSANKQETDAFMQSVDSFLYGPGWY